MKYLLAWFPCLFQNDDIYIEWWYILLILALFSVVLCNFLFSSLLQSGCCCVWENPDVASSIILSDLQLVSQQIFTLWNAFQSVLPHAITQIVQYEKKKWERDSVSTWNNFVYRERYQMEDRWRVGHPNLSDNRKHRHNNRMKIQTVTSLHLAHSFSFYRLTSFYLFSPEIHGRTVNQLRSSGVLTRMCQQIGSGIRDCTPSLQPNEQVVLFEEQFKSHK